MMTANTDLISREALESLLSDTQHKEHECGDTAVYCPVVNAKEVLCTTPAQPLQAHVDEVIEKCAEMVQTAGHGFCGSNVEICFNTVAESIRELKGKP